MGLRRKPWSHIVRILTFLRYDSRILSVWNNAFLEREFRKNPGQPEIFVEVDSKKSATESEVAGSRVGNRVYSIQLPAFLSIM